MDGLTRQLFVVQARPETIHSRKATDRVVEYKIQKRDAGSGPGMTGEKVITTGIAIGDRIGSGKVRIMFSLDGRGGSTDGNDFRACGMLVTDISIPTGSRS